MSDCQHHCKPNDLSPGRSNARLPVDRHLIRVRRLSHGYLQSEVEWRFFFQTAITTISPSTGKISQSFSLTQPKIFLLGSIRGGTQVTIDGYGFQPDVTIVVIADQVYRNFTSLNYSRIVLVTERQDRYVNADFSVSVFVNRSNETICLNSSCQFAWRTASTPVFDSVQPSSIFGPTNITILGRNLRQGNTTVRVSIGEYPCQVTARTNETIQCTTTSLQVGDHPITGWIEGRSTLHFH